MGNIITFHQQEVVQKTIIDIIDALDEPAINEFFSITGNDQEKILRTFHDVTEEVIYGGGQNIVSNQFMYMDAFTDRVDLMMKKLVLSYFITSTLPDFEVSWHHLEWGSLYQQNRYLVIIAARGHGKTVARDTLIPMADGSLKKSQDIIVGDKVMGVDSLPRIVKETHSIEDDGYEIPYQQALSYTVSKDHILHFKRDFYDYKHRKRANKRTEVVEMSADEFYKKGSYYKSKSWGYRVDGWDLPDADLPLESYYLGLWLGDGVSIYPVVTNEDGEVVDYIFDYAFRLGYNVSVNGKNKNNYRITSGAGAGKNYVFDKLRSLNVLGNKHIPEIYLKSSRRQRLELLAGLIDSDGYYSKRAAFSIGMKSLEMIESIQRLAWSLGFRAVVRKNIKTRLKWKNNEEYTHHRVIINGDIWNIPTKIKRKQAQFIKRTQDTHRYKIGDIRPVKRQKFYGFEVDGDHLHLLADGTVMHNSYFFSKAVPLWHLFRYDRYDTDSNRKYGMHLSKKGLLVTSEFKLGLSFMGEILEEVENNGYLKEHIYPDRSIRGSKWGTEHMTTKGGGQLVLRSYGSKMRGLHPGWIIVDDMLDDSSLYSADQRAKSKTFFHSVIVNLLEPGGSLGIIGTPFHQDDLYADLKQKPGWSVFEYPALFPNGEVLWPTKFPLMRLKERLETIGSLNFSREIMVRPVSGESSIFPYEIVKRAFDKTIILAPNIVSISEKFDQIVIGTDFAISSSTSADATAFVVIGVLGEIYRILYMFVGKGLSYDEQMNKISQLNNDFMPDKIIIESNGMQKIFFQLGIDMGLPVLEHHTGREKWNMEHGLPAMSVLFESHRVRLPYGDQKSKDLAELLAGELISYTYDSGKIISTSGHSDIGMALWQAILGAKFYGKGFDFSFI